MPREDMPDLMVVLPGISGSRLSKNGRVIWGLSASALARALLSGGSAIERELIVEDDPVDVDDLGDGIVADALIQDLHMIPGLWKIDGYTKVFDTLKATFAVTEGENLFAFPYDWRRDNRVSARKLARDCHAWLKDWRERSGNADARLILVAHSMGGLVARYFLECLEGWKDTRALITFGTPYRGSLNALDTLANGLREGPFGMIDFTTAARSFTAIYQLLPIYPCYDAGQGALARVAEASGIPNVDGARAQAALAFHREIEAAVTANKALAAYRDGGYRIYPFVGISQSTKQSARLKGGKVELLGQLSGKDRSGDGTVPRVSAEPIEHSAGQSAAFFATRHGSLQNADAALVNLRGLVNSFYLDLGAFRGPGEVAQPGIAQVDLELPDLIGTDTPLRVTARPDNADVTLEARLAAHDGTPVRKVAMQRTADGAFEADFGPLDAGDYTVRVGSGSHQVEPAEDAVAVVSLNAA